MLHINRMVINHTDMNEHTTTKSELTMMWVLCKQATTATCTLLQAYYCEAGTEKNVSFEYTGC